jgi:hypothetical protein
MQIFMAYEGFHLTVAYFVNLEIYIKNNNLKLKTSIIGMMLYSSHIRI